MYICIYLCIYIYIYTHIYIYIHCCSAGSGGGMRTLRSIRKQSLRIPLRPLSRRDMI